MTVNLFYVSFVQQTVKHLVWRLADSTTGKSSFLGLEYCLKGWVWRGRGIIYTSNFTFPAQERERNWWCCRHPSLKGNIFAGWQVRLCFASRSGLFRGIPISSHVSGLERPYSRGRLLLATSGLWTSSVPHDFDFPSASVFAWVLSILLWAVTEVISSHPAFIKQGIIFSSFCLFLGKRIKHEVYCKTTHSLYTSSFSDSYFMEMLLGIKHFRSSSDAHSSCTLSYISYQVKY